MASAGSKSQQRPGISPFRSSPSPQPTKAAGARPATPSSSRPSLPPPSSASPSTPTFDRLDFPKPKENVTVTVRFCPLSAREVKKGDEIAWYADGDYMVRNEYNASIAYGFDRVFGPATTTRRVYDVAAYHVVSGAMQGISGIVFAYGVTSSGKTHTMHGEQKSPGIIPLAVKDVFGIIQEVINDLLDPTGQNLRIREDSQVYNLPTDCLMDKEEGRSTSDGISSEMLTEVMEKSIRATNC